MATITEDYVSFETAKLLKEKGFDCETDMYYSPDGKLKCWIPNGLKSWLNNRGNETWWWKCVAPTLQMAMKWLREVHKLIPIVLTGGNSQNPFYYWFRIDRITKGKLEDAIYREDEKEFSSYEEACEAAIKYCLENLI